MTPMGSTGVLVGGFQDACKGSAFHMSVCVCVCVYINAHVHDIKNALLPVSNTLVLLFNILPYLCQHCCNVLFQNIKYILNISDKINIRC